MSHLSNELRNFVPHLLAHGNKVLADYLTKAADEIEELERDVNARTEDQEHTNDVAPDRQRATTTTRRKARTANKA